VVRRFSRSRSGGNKQFPTYDWLETNCRKFRVLLEFALEIHSAKKQVFMAKTRRSLVGHKGKATVDAL
jgi:hypothetical protein